MNKTIIVSSILVLLFVRSGCNSYAQDSMFERTPTLVLVQLRSEHNRVAAMAKNRDYKLLEKVKRDALAVQTAMINDFQDHFTNCPVYYYMDTNASLVQKKQFGGVLLDADLAPAHPILAGDPGYYLVAYYEYAAATTISSEVGKDSVGHKYDPGEPALKGLVILNSKFQKVAHFSKPGYSDLFSNKKIGKKYRFYSREFDMEYYPFAELFSKKLIAQFGNRTPATVIKNKDH